MIFALILTFILNPIQDIPFKPDSEFSIRIDLQFRARPIENPSEVKFSETRGDYEKRTSIANLPYLTLFLNVSDISSGERRMKILRDGKVVTANRKISVNKEYKLEVGFTDDAKDKISGYKHEIFFLSDNKEQINQIIIVIEENGDYFVNGQKRGRI